MMGSLAGTVAYTAAPITARLVMLCARKIITLIPTYYSVLPLSFPISSPLIPLLTQVWRCDEVLVALASTHPPIDSTQEPYVLCTGPNVNTVELHIPVLAVTNRDNLNFASTVRVTFGMGLWIGMLLHIIGVEFYVSIRFCLFLLPLP